MEITGPKKNKVTESRYYADDSACRYDTAGVRIHNEGDGLKETSMPARGEREREEAENIEKSLRHAQRRKGLMELEPQKEETKKNGTEAMFYEPLAK